MSKRQSVLTRPPGASPPHGRRPGASHRPLRAVALAATVTTFLLIGIGALVRATGSGLGCTGWPKCTPERWLPPLEHHAIIEYSHRMTAFLDIVLVAVLVVIAWRGYRSVPRVFRASSAAAALIVVQAVLGGIVVKGDLAALLVTAHFAAAMILAAALVYTSVAAYTLEARPTPAPDPLTSFARLVSVIAFALLVVGAYVRGENAGLAFTDWPLMQGRLVPELPSVGPVLMFAHRALAVATAVLVGALATWAWRRRAGRMPVSVLASVAAGLYLGQVMIGAALVWSLLSAPARVAHVTVAGLIWGALVAAAATARATGEGAR